MQSQILCSANAVSEAVIESHLSSYRFLSVNRLHGEAKRRLPALCMSGRKSPQTIRFFSEAGKVGSKKSGAAPDSSANGLRPQDLEAREEQQLSSSSGVARVPSGHDFRELRVTDHHLLLLGFVACAMTGALSCVLFAAIPALIALKKAAHSLGKLADAAREELPGTMAAVRLSGMEISDLTMELSDLGQEISAGVKSSSRAVRAAEDGLRRIGSFTSVAVVQERGSGRVEVVRPAVARAARSAREALIQARSLMRSLITLTRISSWLGHFWKFARPWRQKAIVSQPWKV